MEGGGGSGVERQDKEAQTALTFQSEIAHVPGTEHAHLPLARGCHQTCISEQEVFKALNGLPEP